MRWKPKRKNTFEWHLWYAWYPVVVEDEWVWLEDILRKEYDSMGGGGFKYRNVTKQ